MSVKILCTKSFNYEYDFVVYSGGMSSKPNRPG